MPKLNRTRFVSVGPTDARMEDLLLDFRDPDGVPSDTALWLRNGGGKTSWLNLFFSILQPDLRRTRGMAGWSNFQEYFQPDDRAVLVAEWRADAPRAGGQVARFLTGVFCEWGSGSTREVGNLRRLFFSTRVLEEDEGLTLEGLPLFTPTRDGVRGRRTLANFRGEWAALRDRYPHAETFHTDRIATWTEHLQSYGLDPEHFYYQIVMNQEEGGASELVFFDSDEEAIDFLLKMTLKPDTAQKTAENIRTHRENLHKRTNLYLPELDLVEGLIERLEDLRDLSDRRAELFGRVEAGAGRLDALRAVIEERRQETEDDLAAARERARSGREEAESARDEAARATRRRALFRWGHAREELEAHNREYAALETALKAATRSQKVWQVARLLYPVRHAEAVLAERERVLQERVEAHRPLREKADEAAQRYAAALKARLEEVRLEEEASLEAIRTGEKAQEEARKKERELARALTRLEETARALAKTLEEEAEARAILVREGVLQAPGESLEAAGERLGARRDELKTEMDRQRKKQRERDVRLEELSEEASELEGEAGRQEAERDALEATLEEAEAEKEGLETDEGLLRLLEVPHLDLDEAGDGPLGRMREIESRTGEQAVRLELEMAADQRALQSLMERQLLPPLPATEKVLDAVQAAGLQAWSGTHYLAENLPDVEHVRQAIRDRPDVVFGAVVRDGDLEPAREALERAGLTLDRPVMIAEQTAALRPGPSVSGRLVFGPSSDAHFDPDAGMREMARRELRAEEAEAAIAEARKQHRVARALAGRLEAYLEDHAALWWQQTRGALRAARGKLEEIGREKEKIATSRGEIRAAREEADRVIARLDKDLHGVDLDEERLRGHASRFPDDRETLQARAQKLRARIEARLAEEAALEKEREQRQREIAAQRTALEGARRELQDLGERLSRIRFIEPESIAPEAGDTRGLENAYRLHLDRYESKVDEKGLLRQREEAERSLRDHRQKYREALEAQKEKIEDLTETEVEEALDGLADPSQAENRAAEAIEAEQAARSRVGNKSKAVTAAEIGVETIEERYPDLDLTLEALEAERRGSSLPLPELAERARTRAEQARARAEAADEARAGAEEAAGRQQTLLGRIGALEGRIVDTTGPYAELFESAAAFSAALAAARKGEKEPGASGAPPADETPVFGTLEEVTKALNAVRDMLGDAQLERTTLDREREALAGHVRTWLTDDRFEALASQLKRKFQALSPSDLELGSRLRLRELEERRDIIEKDLQQIEESRGRLIRYATGVGEQALRVLHSIDARARVPERVGGFGGTKFLKLHIQEVRDPDERHGRIGQLLDDLTGQEDEIPDGLALAQEAVRRLTRSMRVEILVPNWGREPQYRGAGRFETFSTGQALTLAVMLYCTLLMVRAREAGSRPNPTDVLLLDNPIGKASSRKLLELQREVASAMGIQLVYATGVKDLEAVSMLPHRIRLRNGRVDRRTGRQHLTVESTEDPALEAAHMGQAHAPLVPEPAVLVGGGDTE